MGQYHCPNGGKVPEFAEGHKRVWKNFRQKLQPGDSECNKSNFWKARNESLRRLVNDLDMLRALRGLGRPRSPQSKAPKPDSGAMERAVHCAARLCTPSSLVTGGGFHRPVKAAEMGA